MIGGGFGGISAAKALRRSNVDITLIDRTNHFIFQPLLYQVATAALAPSDITAPIRWILRSQKNTERIMADATEIDVERRVVCVDDDLWELPYDYLIVAPGSRHSYFGHDEWEPYAPGLKAIEDASEIRRRRADGSGAFRGNPVHRKEGVGSRVPANRHPSHACHSGGGWSQDSAF